MPKDGWINWRRSKARELILNDLRTGVLSLDRNETSEEQAWDIYKHMPQFVQEGIVFDQFKQRLRDHRKQMGKKAYNSQRQADALAHDRQLYSRAPHNHRGEPVFDVSNAKPLLRKDVADKKHRTMTPSQLQQSRPEYQMFDSVKFKERIYQEVRRQKFIHSRRLRHGPPATIDG